MRKADFNKTATEGFSMQSAIKRSILKQHNMNATQGTNSGISQHKSERSNPSSANRSTVNT